MDNGSSNDDMMMMMMMPMTFSSWKSYKLQILFTSWDVQTVPQYIASWFLIVILCILLHVLRCSITVISLSMKSKRERTYMINNINLKNTIGLGFTSESSINNLPIDSSNLIDSSDKKRKNVIDRMIDILRNRSLLFLRLLHALLTAINYGLSLLLMLVAMTYNPGLFLALVVGYFFGDLVTSSELINRSIRSTADDGCH